MRLSAVGLGVSAGLIGMAPGRVMIGGSAIMMGAAGAVMMIVVQAFLSDHHGPRAVAAIAEANAVASFAAVAAPLAVALAIAVGFGWAAGFAVPSLLVGGLLGFGLVASIPGPHPGGTLDTSEDRTVAAPWLGSWFAVVLVVAVEFAFVFWATDYMSSVGGIPDATAAAITAMFFIGMALTRALGVRLMRLLEPMRRALLGALAVSGIGFTMFWTAPFSPGTMFWAAVGLLVAGAGVAYLFPLSFLGLVAVLVGGTDKASSRAALGSGVAIGLAPLVLGVAADLLGLTTALLLIPLLLAGAAVNVAVTYPRRSP